MMTAKQDEVALALYLARHDLEDRVGLRVGLVFRDYFTHPELPIDRAWPDEWKELARMNAHLGRMASGLNSLDLA